MTTKFLVRAGRIGLAVLGLSALACQRAPAGKHDRLDAHAGALRTAFEADVGKVRIVMLSSPISTPALHAVADVTTAVMLSNADPRLTAYVVWLPVDGALEDDVGPATHYAIDPRVHHYWDAERGTAAALGLPADTGAAYLVYAAGTRWNEGSPAPAPSAVMHAADLDGEALGKIVADLVERAPPAPKGAGSGSSPAASSTTAPTPAPSAHIAADAPARSDNSAGKISP